MKKRLRIVLLVLAPPLLLLLAVYAMLAAPPQELREVRRELESVSRRTSSTVLVSTIRIDNATTGTTSAQSVSTPSPKPPPREMMRTRSMLRLALRHVHRVRVIEPFPPAIPSQAPDLADHPAVAGVLAQGLPLEQNIHADVQSTLREIPHYPSMDWDERLESRVEEFQQLNESNRILAEDRERVSDLIWEMAPIAVALATTTNRDLARRTYLALSEAVIATYRDEPTTSSWDTRLIIPMTFEMWRWQVLDDREWRSLLEVLVTTKPDSERREEMRRLVLLAKVEDLKAGLASADYEETPLRHMAGGAPAFVLRSVMLPIINARIDELAVALIEEDAAAIKTAHARVEEAIDRAGIRSYSSDLELDRGLGSSSVRRYHESDEMRDVVSDPILLAQAEAAKSLEPWAVIVAGLVYTRENGTIPRDLADLVPDYLPASYLEVPGRWWYFAPPPPALGGEDTGWPFAALRVNVIPHGRTGHAYFSSAESGWYTASDTPPSVGDPILRLDLWAPDQFVRQLTEAFARKINESTPP